MKQNFIILSFLFIGILIFQNCKSGKNIVKLPATTDSVNFERGDYRIMFYNCENYFDIYDDSLKNDDEFTADGAKHWTWNKFEEKVSHISKVITAVGGWEPPDLVGVCEIENQYVLEQLTQHSPLSAFNYKIIHYESPDHRGIDVGLLYIPSKFTPIHTEKILVKLPSNRGKATRDILYVKGITTHNDTLHIFVNHWPSRWGGMLETEPLRMFVASLLKTKTDSIFATNNNAKIIIMGDLNDFPTNKSVLDSLHTLHDFSNIQPDELYNLSYYLQEVKGEFSHRFHGEGGILDQFIVSGTLLNTQATIFTTKDDAHIYNAPFLLEDDPDNVGMRPFRTYIGYKYHGGYSDHLPAYLDLHYQNSRQ